MIFLYILAAVIAFVVVLTAIEIAVLVAKKPAQELPDEAKQKEYSLRSGGKGMEDLYLFLTGAQTEKGFTDDEIYNVLWVQCDYMAHRFDCADFRAQMLFKIYKDCNEKLNEECKALIRDTFLNFKYFMDEPGYDSMCYWSENHQILFAVSEYLAGQEWPQAVFVNDGRTGAAHMQKATERIDAWMQQRFAWGFTEYLSNNYLAEDLAPMANFIAYANDRSRVEQMKIIMDILWLDVALHSVNNRFVSTSARMYGNNKMGNFYGNSILSAMNALWGREQADRILADRSLSDAEKDAIRISLAAKPNHIVMCFTDIVQKGIYTLPSAIRDIALTDEAFSSRMCCGLSVEEMEQEGLIGQAPAQIMMQLGAETFTPPQVIENTLLYLKTNNMYRNSFLVYFKFLQLSVLQFVNWRKFAAKHEIMPHGIAIGKGNVYSYRTPRYAMSTSVCKDINRCGAQEHIWVANISENLTLFTTHPAGNGKGRYGASPGYWIGNGRRPVSVQHENVNITVYRLPTEKRLGETGIADMTHAYMPKAFYDELEHCGNTVFARKNGVFVALIADGELQFKPYDSDSAEGIHKGRQYADRYMLSGEFDLCRTGGRYHSYVTELSDIDRETFAQFKERIRKNEVVFGQDGFVCYKTSFGELTADFDGTCTLNGQPLQTQFDRYDSKFCHAERNPRTLTVDSGKHTLELDFKACKRREYNKKQVLRGMLGLGCEM